MARLKHRSKVRWREFLTKTDEDEDLSPREEWVLFAAPALVIWGIALLLAVVSE